MSPIQGYVLVLGDNHVVTPRYILVSFFYIYIVQLDRVESLLVAGDFFQEPYGRVLEIPLSAGDFSATRSDRALSGDIGVPDTPFTTCERTKICWRIICCGFLSVTKQADHGNGVRSSCEALKTADCGVRSCRLTKPICLRAAKMMDCVHRVERQTYNYTLLDPACGPVHRFRLSNKSVALRRDFLNGSLQTDGRHGRL